MKRREFLKKTTGSAAAVGFAGNNILIQGCSGKKEYDIIIQGGLVFDGAGTPGKMTDIAIAGDKVVAMAPCYDKSQGKNTGVSGRPFKKVTY